MIYLFTGAIGASKTLNAIKFVSEDEKFKDRQVYYFNISELSLDWKKIDNLSDCRNWMSLPDKSVIFIDECQDAFPPRKVGSDVPKYISSMNTSRHRGIDFILITQHPTLFDSQLRKLVNQHIHIERRFQADRAIHFRWEKCINNPDDYHARKDALETTVTIDKKYFDIYKSAVEHTGKRNLPMSKIIISLSAVVFSFSLIAGALFYVIPKMFKKNSGNDDEIVTEHVDTSKKESNDKDLFYNINDRFITDDVDLTEPQSFVPTNPDIPWSAPAYREILEVSDYPRPQCYYLHSDDVCRCFTQQATPLNISKQSCLNYVNNGYFDPFVTKNLSHEYKSEGKDS